jgi:protein-L-isoaspartate(D-aspartate) O-methyltransferase
MAAALLATALIACQRRELATPAIPESTAQTARDQAGDASTSSVLSPSDLPTSGLRLNVPKASLRALADATFRRGRLDMVEHQIRARDVRDPRVLEAMRRVPRHEFVPREFRRYSYVDSPLEIGHEQTISQPYIVALMTELLRMKPEDRVLEIGTGSGYQAAVLSVLVKEVYTIEIVEPLAKRAESDLRRLGYDNVHVLCGDGYRGWPDKAPFDGVIVTAAPETIPQPLMDQLKTGGRLVIPVGPRFDQELVVVNKTERGPFRETVIPVRFVPMVGEVQKERPAK